MNKANPHDVIVGIDTHKHTHAAVAVTGLGARVGELTIRIGLGGYRALEAWAQSLGAVRAFGIEGTGSYGAGLARFLRAAGHTVHEAGRPDRGLRHRHGKTDHLEAVAGKMALVRHLAALRRGLRTTTTASAKASLRAIARRWLDLDAEIGSHDAHLGQLTARCAPEMVAAHGMGTATAAEMLILVGDNPERIRSEAAFAKLCGACPVPASSGKTSRHRLNRGGHRQANAALHRVVVVRMRTHQPTLDYLRRRTAEGKSKREIIRCLKRFVAREIFGYLCRDPKPTRPEQVAA